MKIAPTPNVPPDEMARARWLLPWMSEAEALTAMLGRPITPSDDLTAPRSQLARIKSAIGKRRWIAADPRVGDAAWFIKALRERPDLVVSMADTKWEPAFVDLARTQAMQKVVTIDGLDGRVAPALLSRDALLELCIPSVPTEIPDMRMSQDQDGRGLTLSSPNPNFRVTGAALGPVPTPAGQRNAFQIFMAVLSSYVTLTEYRGRFFLRDGYHRCVGLMLKGVTRVPAIFTRARTMQELAPTPGLFAEDVLFSDNPPLLTDFLDGGPNFTAPRTVGRKYVRARGDEYFH